MASHNATPLVCPCCGEPPDTYDEIEYYIHHEKGCTKGDLEPHSITFMKDSYDILMWNTWVAAMATA